MQQLAALPPKMANTECNLNALCNKCTSIDSIEVVATCELQK